MVIIDLNQITFSNLFMQVKKFDDVNEEFLRYMILNSIRAYNSGKLFKGRGEVIIACDSKENWRKDIFPYYKANRKKKREESTINWDKVFSAFDTVKSELKEFFPYTVIDVPKTEADDIIAVLSKQGEKTLILSGDTDFMQLHDGFLIEQYSPVQKKFISTRDPNYLKQHILEGDSSDGIPNICSPDDTFVLNKRQKRLTSKKAKFFIDCEPEDYPAEEKRNYYRNKQLIDLTCIPEIYKLEIQEQYDSRPTKNKSKLFNYFFDRKLTKFIDSIQDF